MVFCKCDWEIMANASKGQLLFKTKGGFVFPGVSSSVYQDLWSELLDSYSVTPCQITEAASYSMAMVVRYALGLSASGGKTAALAADSYAGAVALATVRHLTNAGAAAVAVLTTEEEHLSENLRLQTSALKSLGVPVQQLDQVLSGAPADFISSCHNIICGLYDKQPTSYGPSVAALVELMNESRTPVHAVELPLMINPDNGESTGTPLFASSTLSLGAPLAGLHAGSDYAGRHYLCDISVPPFLYAKHAQTNDVSPLFAEQPVVQIFPLKEGEAA